MHRQHQRAESADRHHRAMRLGETHRIDLPASLDLAEAHSRLQWTNEAFSLLTQATADLLSAEQPESSFEQLFCRIMTHLGCDFFANYDYVNDRLHLVCSAGFTPEMTEAIRILPIGELLCGRTACVTDLLYLPNASAMTEPHMQVLHDIGGQVFIGLPLRDKGQLVGTLSFGSTTRSSLGDEELDFLRTLRNTVSAAKARTRDTRALMRSEARYRAVTDSCLDGLIVLNGQGTISEVNDVYLRLSGYSLAELLGKPLGSLDESDLPFDLSALLEKCRLESRVRMTTTHRTAAGKRWPVELTISGHGGESISYLVVVRDLTERLQSEQTLRDAEERVREAIENANIVLWEANPSTGNFQFVTGSTEKMLGFSNQEWLEPGFWLRQVHPDDRDSAFEFCQQATQRLRDHRFEYRMIKKNGDVVWIEDFVSLAIANGKATLLRGVLIDITFRKRIEQQLAQARKMEAIGRLAGGVAHDFNNLLTVINGYSELLQMSFEATDQRLEWVKNLISAGERACRLTDQLLLFARTSAIGREPVEMNDLVSSSVSLLQRLIPDDIRLELELTNEPTWVSADRGMLEQIVLNLAINSRDAMPLGGRIQIKTEVIQRARDAFKTIDGQDATLGVLLTDSDSPSDDDLVSCISLTVVDDGIGMTEEQKSRIFDPFFTTKEVGKGTGLGMAVVYGATRQNGGLVEVESSVGNGTRVSVILPQTPNRPASKSTQIEYHQQANETILLVEDENQVRELAKLTLEQQGYRVLEASSGVEAIKLSKKFSGTIDLLVTDVVMAGQGGRQLADQLRIERPNLKVLFISGYTDDAVLRHGVAAGIDHFLRKPFTSNTLAASLREVLNRSRSTIET